MTLTDSQLETIRQNIQKNTTGLCPMCGNRTWTIDQNIVTNMVTSLSGTTEIGGGPIIPLVRVICNICGFVAFYALGRLGVKLN